MGALWLTSTSAVCAMEAQLQFALPRLGPGDAALAIALRGGLSIGLSVVCKGLPVKVRGRMTARAALDHALSASDCQAVWVDAQTVRIDKRPALVTERALSPTISSPHTAIMSQIIVTASKRALSDFELPGSVSVETAAALAAVQARDTADLRLLASGVTVTNLGPGRDKVLLRGLSDGAFTGHTQSTVGLYWNETPVTYNAPDPDLRLLDVDSVEVLRGPQGTLYGGGALGGVVSVSPNAPDPSGVVGSLAVSGATTASGDPGGDVEAVVNAPLADGRAALRIVAYGEDDGGYIDLPRLTQANVNRTQESGARAALRLAPTAAWSVTVGDIYQRIYSNDTQYTTGPPAALQRDSLVRQPHDNDFEQVYLDTRGRGGWGDLRSVASFIHHEFDSRYDASTVLPEFGGTAGLGAYDDDTSIRLTSEELDYRAPRQGPLSLLAGVYGGYGDEHETTALGPLQAASLYNEDRTDRLIDLAVFSEASYALSPRLTLTLGLRLAYAERRTLSAVEQGVNRAPFSGTIGAREWSPKLAADYTLIRGVRLYGLASRGYRIGGFNTAGPIGTVFTSPGADQPNRRYLSDALWNFEAGLKAEGWRGRFEARTAIYYDVWSRLQADQFLPSGLPYVANVGDADIAGWEWEASVRPLRPLLFGIGALFTAPDLRRADPNFALGRSDFTLPGVARRSINGRIGYERPLSRDRTLEFNAVASYVGHSYLFFGPQGSAEMGRYLDARVQADVRTLKWKLGLEVANPANNRGDTFAFGNPFTLATEAQTTPLRPRTIRLTLARGF